MLESPQLPQGVRLAQVAEGIPQEELEGVIPTPGEQARHNILRQLLPAACWLCATVC